MMRLTRIGQAEHDEILEPGLARDRLLGRPVDALPRPGNVLPPKPRLHPLPVGFFDRSDMLDDRGQRVNAAERVGHDEGFVGRNMKQVEVPLEQARDRQRRLQPASSCGSSLAYSSTDFIDRPRGATCRPSSA